MERTIPDPSPLPPSPQFPVKALQHAEILYPVISTLNADKYIFSLANDQETKVYYRVNPGLTADKSKISKSA